MIHHYVAPPGFVFPAVGWALMLVAGVVALRVLYALFRVLRFAVRQVSWCWSQVVHPLGSWVKLRVAREACREQPADVFLVPEPRCLEDALLLVRCGIDGIRDFGPFGYYSLLADVLDGNLRKCEVSLSVDEAPLVTDSLIGSAIVAAVSSVGDGKDVRYE